MHPTTAPTRSYAPGGYRELLHVAWPMILSTASYTVMHFSARLMLARYSGTTAAASTCAGATAFSFLSLFQGIAGYTNTFIAQYHGSGNKEMCTRSLWQGIYFALLAGLLFPLVCRPLGHLWLAAIGHEPDILAAEQVYFGVVAWGAIFPLLSVALASFFSGRGDTWTVMWVSATAALVNIIFNYAMIFGAWGFPEWGIYGAALATNIGAATGMLIYLALLSRRRWRIEYGMWRLSAFRRATFMRLIRFGGPSGLSFALDIMAFTMFVLFIGRVGRTELIASNITLAINSLAFMPMLGFSIATNIMVGQHIGEKRIATAERSAYSGVKLAMLYMTLMGIVFVAAPDMLLRLFQGGRIPPALFEQVMRHGRMFLMMLAAMGVLDALNTVFSGALKGAGDTLFCMWSNVVIAWGIFVPPLYLMVSVWHVRASYAYAWMVVYVALLALVYTWRFQRGAWKTIEIKERVPAAPLLPEAALDTPVA